MNKKNTLLFPGIFSLTLLLSGCGDDSTISGSGGSGTASGLALSYLNSRNGNALIALSPSSTFPTLPVDHADRNTVGNFYQTGVCVGTTIPYTFKLTNNGSSSMTAAGSPVVEFNDTTIYFANFNPPVTYNITVPPTFPIAAGQSTTLTMELTNNNNGCTFGGASNGSAPTTSNFEMIVHTNDSANPNYSVEFTVLGNS